MIVIELITFHGVHSNKVRVRTDPDPEGSDSESVCQNDPEMVELDAEFGLKSCLIRELVTYSGSY